MGEQVAPVNVTAETVTLNRITYGPHSNEAVLSGGKHLRLSDEEMERDRLEALMRQTGFSFRQIEIQRPIDFLKQAAIVDTPGLGDAMDDFSGLVEEALAQADAVVYVFSVNYPLSQTEQLFLKTMIVPQKYTDLLLVGNYLDMLGSAADYERMEISWSPDPESSVGPEALAFERPGRALPSAGRGAAQSAMEKELGEHFDRFRGEISRLAEEKKELILPDRMQRLARGMIAEVSESLDALEEGLRMSSQDVKEAMDRVQEEKENQIRTQEETGRRIDSLIETMKGECRNGWESCWTI